MTTIPPPIANERDYVAWFVKTSPEFEVLRSWIAGDIDRYASFTADWCESRRVKIDTADKLFEEYQRLCTVYTEKILPFINEYGGLDKLLTMPPKLIDLTIQVLAQIFVFKEILVRRYDHRRSRDLFTALDAAEKARG
jgi:hypothetical protein